MNPVPPVACGSHQASGLKSTVSFSDMMRTFHRWSSVWLKVWKCYSAFGCNLFFSGSKKFSTMASTSSSSSFCSCAKSLPKEGTMFELCFLKKERRDFLLWCPDLPTHSPVPRSSAQLSVVFNFGLGAAGAHGGHAPVGEGEGDHLAGARRRKNLGAQRESSAINNS